MKQAIITLTLLASGLLSVEGRVEMPHVFSDNMVLQADTSAVLWGKAAPVLLSLLLALGERRLRRKRLPTDGGA